jgi:hypothetical protein
MGILLMNKIYAMFTTIHQKEALAGKTWIEQMNRHKEGILKTSQRGIPENKDAQNMAKRLKEHGAQYFVFITEDIPPTNNPGEQVIRMLVIDRKVTQGTRSDAGNRWHERFWSILTTCNQRGINIMSFLQECMVALFHRRAPPPLLQSS